MPTEYEGGDKRASWIGWTDPRQTEGELLWPERFGPKEVEDSKRMLGSYAYAAQHLQRPSPSGGGLIKRAWFRFYNEAPSGLTGHMLSIDCAFRETSKSDFVVIQCWARRGADKFLLDQFRKRLDFPGTVAAVRMMSGRWPNARLKVVEEKANGAAVISSLRCSISGLVSYVPKESKAARVSAVSPEIESGNIYLPAPAVAPWVEEFITECCCFPNWGHDDQVDCMSQALLRMKQAGPFGYQPGWII